MIPGVIGREPNAEQRRTGPPGGSLDQRARGFLLAWHVPDPAAERDLIGVLRVGKCAQHDVKPRLARVRVPVGEIDRVRGPAAQHESGHALVFLIARRALDPSLLGVAVEGEHVRRRRRNFARVCRHGQQPKPGLAHPVMPHMVTSTVGAADAASRRRIHLPGAGCRSGT